MGADRVQCPKPKLLQLFCRHDADWYKKNAPFHNLSGETHYYICKKCGKVLITASIPNP